MAGPYYSLISGLPELSINDKSLLYDMISYRELVKDSMAAEDFEMLQILYYRFDISNFVAIVKELDKPWNEAGNLSKEELEEGIQMPELLPEFFRNFFDTHDSTWKDLSTKQLKNAVTSSFLDWTRNIPNRFVKKWISFDQNLKNLLIWLNATKFKMDVSEDVLGESHEAEYLRKTGPDDLDLKSWDNAYKEALTHFDNPNIAVREFVIEEMRWKYLDEIEQDYYFTKERLMAFAVRLQIIDRNIRTTEGKGKERLNKLMTDIQEGYQLPETFV